MKRFFAVLMAIVTILGIATVFVSAEDAEVKPVFSTEGLADIPQILENAFPKATGVIEFLSPVLRIPMFAYALVKFLGAVLFDIFS